MDYLGTVNASDPEQKQRLRELCRVFLGPLVRGVPPGEPVSALIIDALNPNGTLFAQELLVAGLNRKHIFSPNRDPNVVTAGRALDLPFAVRAEALDFVREYEASLAACGGVDLAFLDVHGCFARGALPLIQDLLERRLMRGRAGFGSLICFAMSDLHERFQDGGTTRAQIARDVLDTITSVVRQSREYVHWPLDRLHNGIQTFYSSTMAVYAFRVMRLVHAAPVIGKPVYNLDAEDLEANASTRHTRPTYDAVTLNF